jgi:hypothetical protein
MIDYDYTFLMLILAALSLTQSAVVSVEFEGEITSAGETRGLHGTAALFHFFENDKAYLSGGFDGGGREWQFTFYPDGTAEVTNPGGKKEEGPYPPYFLNRKDPSDLTSLIPEILGQSGKECTLETINVQNGASKIYIYRLEGREIARITQSLSQNDRGAPLELNVPFGENSQAVVRFSKISFTTSDDQQ